MLGTSIRKVTKGNFGVKTVRAYIYAGPVLEVEEYQCLRIPKKGLPRGPNRTVTSEEQRKLNNKYALKKFERKINANFKPFDMFITLDYGEEPSEEEAKRIVWNYLRRIVYACKKKGVKVKYMCVTEKATLQGEVRLHHHIIMNRISYDLVDKLWTLGGVTVTRLYSKKGFRALAKYLSKDPTKGRMRERRWTCSQNLIEPTIRRFSIKRITKKPKIPDGYYLDGQWEYVSDLTGLIWVARYIQNGCENYGKRLAEEYG